MKSKKQRQSEALSRWYTRLEVLGQKANALPVHMTTDSAVEAERAYITGRMIIAKNEIKNLEAKGVR